VKDIVKFYFDFERIYPFQDGNGRVGRLIMFKECLAQILFCSSLIPNTSYSIIAVSGNMPVFRNIRMTSVFPHRIITGKSVENSKHKINSTTPALNLFCCFMFQP